MPLRKSTRLLFHRGDIADGLAEVPGAQDAAHDFAGAGLGDFLDEGDLTGAACAARFVFTKSAISFFS